jgi:uncharacterized protein (TIGR01244 family)
MHSYTKAFYLFFLALFFIDCSSTNTSKENLIPPPSIWERAVIRDRVYITGQPSEAEIRTLPEKGIIYVVNARTTEEMNNRSEVPFIEDSIVRSAGMVYVHLPIGGEKYPYSPQILDTLAKVLQADTGKILLHCKSGGRTAWLYASYELKYLGKNPQEIMKWLEKYGFWPLPLEKLTGIPLELRKKE